MNVHCSLRRGKNDPEKVFQGSPQGCYSYHRPRSKAVSSLVLKGRLPLQIGKARMNLPSGSRTGCPGSHVGGSLQRPKGLGCLAETRVILSPQWAWKTEYWVQEDCSGALISNGICLARIWDCWNPSSPPSFWFLPFRMGQSIPCLPTTVFWEHITWLVS